MQLFVWNVHWSDAILINEFCGQPFKELMLLKTCLRSLLNENSSR